MRRTKEVLKSKRENETMREKRKEKRELTKNNYGKLTADSVALQNYFGRPLRVVFNSLNG